MNLETQIRQVRSRLATPRRALVSEDYITDTEILEWIRQAELQVIKDVAEREKFITQATVAAVAAQELYSRTDTGFPVDVVDIVRVTYAGVECNRHPAHEIAALELNTFRRPRKGFNQYFYEIAGTFGTSKIGIRPVPDDTSPIVIWYVQAPYRRFKHLRGITTAVGAATEIIDSGNLKQPNNYWVNAEVRLFDGLIQGEERIVSASDLGTTKLTTTTAWPVAVAQNVTYELGEVSELPAELEPLVTAWATYLGQCKGRDAGDASLTRTEYDAQIAKHNARYGYGRTEPTSEPVGTNKL